MVAMMCLITQSVLTTLSGKIEVRTVLWARLWSWNNFRHMPKLNCENWLGWGVSPEASIDLAKTGTDWLKPREDLGSDAAVTQGLGSAVSQEGDTRSLGHPSPSFKWELTNIRNVVGGTMMLPKSSGGWLESQGVVGKFSLVLVPSWQYSPTLLHCLHRICFIGFPNFPLPFEVSWAI